MKLKESMGGEAKMSKAQSKTKQVQLPTKTDMSKHTNNITRLAVTSSALCKCVKAGRGGSVYLRDIIVKLLQCFLAVSESVAGAFT